MDTITSVHNARVSSAASLKQKKHRDAQGRYVIEGHRGVAEALADGVVETLFVTVEAAHRYGDESGVDVVVVADHVLDRLADSRTPQGVVAVAARRPSALSDVIGRGFLVACHQVADPGNAGTIIRTADAAGASGVVLTRGSVDPYNPKAVRASAGSLTHLPVVVDVDLDELFRACAAAGQRIAALDPSGSLTVDDPTVLEPPVVLLFGSEAHGLPSDALSRADATVSVPSHGRAESLNLAAAVAVTAYAAARAGGDEHEQDGDQPDATSNPGPGDDRGQRSPEGSDGEQA